MDFPREWELNLNKDGDGNGNENNNKMGVGTVNACRVPKSFPRIFAKSHYTTLCALCLRLSHKSPCVIYVCIL